MFTSFFYQNRASFKGFYVELGAFDGHEESNTRLFDECLHWDGLLIEGNPGIYRKLKHNRPHAHRFFGAPSCPNVGSSVSFWNVPYTSGGLLALARTGNGTSKHLVTVPCFPIQHALDTMGVARVDFFSLDVEGAEMDVLRTLNFTRTKIRVFLIEVSNRLCAKDRCAAK